MKTVDKNKLRQRIKHLNGITDDDRATLLELLEEKTFGLVWEDQKEEVNERMRHELPILIEIPDRAILSGESEAPDHILIEGDNLVSLTTLSFTHAGKIDVIYIDPPYNTGNKISEDFIYNDNFVAKETQYRHSKWLSFMSKRLRIAKKLLSERGVIFISIDDNEQAHLKLLCDEIFGRQNFFAHLIWSAGRKNDSRYISISHEYILIYVKNQEFLKSNDITWRERKPGLDDIYNCYRKLAKRYGADYETISLELRQWYKGLPNGHPAKDSSHYCKVDARGIYFPDNISAQSGRTRTPYDVIHPVTGKPCKRPGRGWPSYQTMQRLIAEDLVDFGQDETKVPCLKSYLSNREYQVPYSVFYVDGRAATKTLADIIGTGKFNNPKDIDTIKRLIDISSTKESIVLDFFAGSGTTLHAVMRLNATDKGTRQCILCTNNEKDICEKITYPRCKKVIEGYTKPNGEIVPGLHYNNLRYYRTGFVGRRRSPKNMRHLMALSSDMLCIKENIYTECERFLGMATVENGFRYFASDSKQMLIIYNEESIYPIVDALEQTDLTEPITICIFCPGADAWDSEFESVHDKVRLMALPAAIYNAYTALNTLPNPADYDISAGETKATVTSSMIGREDEAHTTRHTQ